MRAARVDLLLSGGRVEGARGAVARWATREGLTLLVHTADGRVGQGEASPLPGYSPDTLEGARRALAAIDFAALPEPEPGVPVDAYLDAVDRAAPALPPSARFALETALLDLAAQRARTPLWATLCEALPGGDVPLSALIGGADEPLVAEAARAAADRGAHTVKVKIAGPHLGEQLPALERVRDAIGAIELRLDANGTLPARDAERELAALVPLRPELVEEPVARGSLAELRASPVPLALDESLQDPGELERLGPHRSRLRVRAVVLKPMALGGVRACRDLSRRAASLGLHVTFSHLFDGPIGLAATAHLALALGSRVHASGLSPHGGLAAWAPRALPLIGPTSLVAADAPGLGLDLPEGSA